MTSLSNQLIASRFRIGPKMGSWSFGDIHLATDQNTGTIFALKRVILHLIIPQQNQKIKHSLLQTESKVLKAMAEFVGFPNLEWYGTENRSRIIIMELLGPSLQDLFEICGKRLSLKTVLMIADQLIQKIELLHSKHYIHRDVRPENFLMGIGKNSHILHCNDFGSSKKYRDLKTLQHIPYKENKSLTGSALYSSINAHMGIEVSRRDDLESIGYVLIYLLQGGLPWQGISAHSKLEKHQKIMQNKMSIPVEILCRGLPTEFSTYINYSRTLNFQEKADYNYLRRMFRDLFQRLNFQLDFLYDWTQLGKHVNYTMSKHQIQIMSKGQQIFIDFTLEQKQDQKKLAMLSGEENVQDDDNSFQNSNINLLKLNTSKKPPFATSSKDIFWD